MAEEYMREWKYRAWHPVEKKMYSPEDLEEPDTEEDAPKTIFGQLIDGKLHIVDVKTDPMTELVPMQSTNWFDQEQNDPPMELIPMQNTGWTDAEGKELYEGDILVYGEYDEIVQIIWSDEVGQFMLMANDGTLSPGDISIVVQMALKGNIYQDPSLVPQF